MNAPDAVKVAKSHLTETFGEDLGSQPMLDEVWFDEKNNNWMVGLSIRLAEMPSDKFRDPLGLGSLPKYKMVVVSESNGKVLSIRNREEIAY